MEYDYEAKVRSALKYLKGKKLNAQLASKNNVDTHRIKYIIRKQNCHRLMFRGGHSLLSDIIAVGLGFDCIGGFVEATFVKIYKH